MAQVYRRPSGIELELPPIVIDSEPGADDSESDLSARVLAPMVGLIVQLAAVNLPDASVIVVAAAATACPPAANSADTHA